MRDNELMPHRGVAGDDPRNAGPIEYFRRRPVTRESLRRTLTANMCDKDRPEGGDKCDEGRLSERDHAAESGQVGRVWVAVDA
jgi:hypothetical protein